MEAVPAGTPVFAVDGRRVGVVEAVSDCCVAVVLMGEHVIRVSAAAVLSAGTAGLSLLCTSDRISKYPCTGKHRQLATSV
jgi:hypothetical protein